MFGRRAFAAVVAAATGAVALPALAWDASLSGERVLSAGRVVNVDTDAGKITIEHQPITQLYMESMTMIFRVKDPAMLIGLTPGDKIRFRVERDTEGFVITRIENSI